MDEASVVLRVCGCGSGNHFLWRITDEQFFTCDGDTLPAVALVDLLSVRPEPFPISVEPLTSRVSLGDRLGVGHFFHDYCGLMVCHRAHLRAAGSPSRSFYLPPAIEATRHLSSSSFNLECISLLAEEERRPGSQAKLRSNLQIGRDRECASARVERNELDPMFGLSLNMGLI